MNSVDVVGWAASALMLLTFACERAWCLRSFAIAANLTFITYGWLDGIHPVLALHLLLLPINVTRLASALRRRKPNGVQATPVIVGSISPTALPIQPPDSLFRRSPR